MSSRRRRVRGLAAALLLLPATGCGVVLGSQGAAAPSSTQPAPDGPAPNFLNPLENHTEVGVNEGSYNPPIYLPNGAPPVTDSSGQVVTTTVLGSGGAAGGTGATGTGTDGSAGISDGQASSKPTMAIPNGALNSVPNPPSAGTTGPPPGVDGRPVAATPQLVPMCDAVLQFFSAGNALADSLVAKPGSASGVLAGANGLVSSLMSLQAISTPAARPTLQSLLASMPLTVSAISQATTFPEAVGLVQSYLTASSGLLNNTLDTLAVSCPGLFVSGPVLPTPDEFVSGQRDVRPRA